mgnify:CR=1 FL=1
MLLVSKILNSESNSQPRSRIILHTISCCWYQRYWILKAIHNYAIKVMIEKLVVVGIKDTEFWKQFTTIVVSNFWLTCCCWYQRYWILKAIHNTRADTFIVYKVVVGIKDTEFWKQFTTIWRTDYMHFRLLLVSKILNSESNSQQIGRDVVPVWSCCWYQRYWILKAIHNT